MGRRKHAAGSGKTAYKEAQFTELLDQLLTYENALRNSIHFNIEFKHCHKLALYKAQNKAIPEDLEKLVKELEPHFPGYKLTLESKIQTYLAQLKTVLLKKVKMLHKQINQKKQNKNLSYCLANQMCHGKSAHTSLHQKKLMDY